MPTLRRENLNRGHALGPAVHEGHECRGAVGAGERWADLTASPTRGRAVEGGLVVQRCAAKQRHSASPGTIENDEKNEWERHAFDHQVSLCAAEDFNV